MGRDLEGPTTDAEGRIEPRGCQLIEILGHARQRLILAADEPEADDAPYIDGGLRRVADEAIVEALEVSGMR